MLGTAEVNEILSLRFIRPLIPVKGLLLIRHGGSALTARRSLGMRGQNSGTQPQKHKHLFHCMSVARLKPLKEPCFSLKRRLKHRENLLQL